jgi:predicted amidohydrolase
MKIVQSKRKKSWFCNPLLYWIIALLATACIEYDETNLYFENGGLPIEYIVTNPTDSLKVAVVCMQCSPSPQGNLNKVNTIIDSALTEAPDIEYFCFGEGVLNKYFGTHYLEEDYSITIPDTLTDSLGSVCQHYQIYLSIGIIIRNGDYLNNAMVTFDPNGEIISIHKKNSLSYDEISEGYVGIKKHTILYINNFKIGVSIEDDTYSEWMMQQYIDEDIDILISPFSEYYGGGTITRVSRQIDAWQLVPNRYGEEITYGYEGVIFISDPMGNEVVSDYGKETYITYTIKK